MKYSSVLKKFFLPLGKLSLIAILWLGSVYAFDAINKTHFFSHTVTTDVSADGNINIWWPTQGARIDNTQAFKAQVQDKNVSDYTMTWSVDGGQQNPMSDSSTDYPHKEAMVDLKNWTWKGSGPYKVTFSALDKDNNPLGQSSIDIYTPEPAQGPTTVEVAIAQQTASTSPSASISQTVQNVLSTLSGISTVAAQTQPAAVTQSQTTQQKVLTALWPTANAAVSGTTQFKATIEGMPTASYKMYWQVDGGTQNIMDNWGDRYQSSVDVSGWSWRDNNQYKITFIAQDNNNNTIGTTDVTITVSKNSDQTSTQSIQITPVQPTPVVTKTIQNLVAPTPVQASGNNPFAGAKLWVNPNSDAKKTADAWRSSRPQDAYQMDKIAQSPDVIWLGGWNNDISGFVKDKVSEVKSQGALPVFIAYNIPGRDCGQYSAGGVGGSDEYRAWIRKIADSIGSNKAIVVLEPDGTTLTDCLGSHAADRYALIKDAVAILKSKGSIGVYIDAGHPGWINAAEMASRLTQSGIAQADGFSLNISNFQTTQANIDYGTQISNQVGGKHFIIDTGRNGLGATADNQWCNPSGRALGNKPTTNTGNARVDAFLWIKGPGGSDGNCNGGPSAGVWWSDYALDMAKRSSN